MPTRNLSAYELARLATKGFLATITALFQSGICKKKLVIELTIGIYGNPKKLQNYELNIIM
jgi:hypothetical protein